MDTDLQLFVALAQIAGVFVGFGALISATRRSDEQGLGLAPIRAVVTTGLVVIVAALVPLVLAGYGASDGSLWFISSLVFLALSWAVILLALRSPEDRRLVTVQARERPYSSTFYWLVLEVPVQLPLIVALLGVAPDLGQALYATALVFNFFQAAFVLAQFVSTQASRWRSPGGGSYERGCTCPACRRGRVRMAEGRTITHPYDFPNTRMTPRLTPA